MHAEYCLYISLFSCSTYTVLHTWIAKYVTAHTLMSTSRHTVFHKEHRVQLRIVRSLLISCMLLYHIASTIVPVLCSTLYNMRIPSFHKTSLSTNKLTNEIGTQKHTNTQARCTCVEASCSTRTSMSIRMSTVNTQIWCVSTTRSLHLCANKARA